VKDSLQKERELATSMRESFLGTSNNSGTQDIQLQLQEFKDVDEAIINEQNDDIKEIEKNLQELSECFVDVAQEVDAQKADLAVVESNTQAAKQAVEYGTKELDKANKYAISIRKKYVLIVVAILCALIAIILIIYFSVKK